jgi:histone H3/H4
MAKAKKGKGGAAAAKPAEMMLVASKVKQAIRDAGCNTAGDALDGLNAYVAWLVGAAVRRATENGRKTVRAHDFHI